MRISDWSSDVCSSDLDAVDDDILAIDPAAFANPGQPGRNQQGEAFAHHAGRAVELADGAPVRGAIAGFLLKPALRRDLRSPAGHAVAEQSRGKFAAVDFPRNTLLIAQTHMEALVVLVARANPPT